MGFLILIIAVIIGATMIDQDDSKHADTPMINPPTVSSGGVHADFESGFNSQWWISSPDTVKSSPRSSMGDVGGEFEGYSREDGVAPVSSTFSDETVMAKHTEKSEPVIITPVEAPMTIQSSVLPPRTGASAPGITPEDEKAAILAGKLPSESSVIDMTDPRCQRVASYAKTIFLLKSMGIKHQDIGKFSSESTVTTFPIQLIQADVYNQSPTDALRVYSKYQTLCDTVGYDHLFNVLKR